MLNKYYVSNGVENLSGIMLTIILLRDWKNCVAIYENIYQSFYLFLYNIFLLKKSLLNSNYVSQVTEILF